MTIAESIQLNKEQIARAFGVPAHMLADPDHTAVPRTWSLCMTSENHGTVGPAGCKFTHAPDKHERVLVVEVPAAAGAPADQINLRLVGPREDLPVAEFEGYVDGEPLVRWMDRDNMPRVGTKLFTEAAANKAEVDLSDVELADPEYVRAYIAGLQEIIEDLSKRTPTATTGASTARPDWLEYDPADHILTIYGVKYSADLFSGLGLGPVGMSFTILAREDGALTLCRGPVAAQAAPLPVQAAPAPAERIECWSHNEEDFSAKSLGELIDTHELQPGATVWAGEAVHPEPSSLFSTDWVIENMGEAAYDIAGEHGGEDYPNVSDEQVAELEALVIGWITKFAPPTFWTVKNVRPYVLTAEDCGEQASTSGERQEGGAA